MPNRTQEQMSEFCKGTGEEGHARGMLGGRPKVEVLDAEEALLQRQLACEPGRGRRKGAGEKEG